ncbi:MAG: GH116 family glycosyl-hydrolase [Candidatus Hydrogenedentales bacterium]|jgi:uncharacterized protein (DUF608 family)
MPDSGYSCCGGKSCCAGKSGEGLNRRDFIKTAAIAAGGLSLAAAQKAQAEALEVWTKSLTEPGARRIYRGAELTHIAMPLGGIGGGQVYLRGDGTLNPWQMVNNFNFGATTKGSCFAIRAKAPGVQAVTRLLQSRTESEARGVDAIEFEGEYPFAWLRYLDDNLPVSVRMEAYSPFIPLNSKDSAIPAVVFRFTVRNTGQTPVEVSLLAAAPNLLGWDGYRPLEGVAYTEAGFNLNTYAERVGQATLHLGAKEGNSHAFSAPIRIQTNDANVALHMRHAASAKVKFGMPLPIEQEGKASDVHWVSDTAGQLTNRELETLLDAVEKGATAVLSNDHLSLLTQVRRRGNAGDVDIFEDWESGDFGDWTVEGTCFGSAPVTGTLHNQLPVSGWDGKYYLSSFANGDPATGKATSRPFTIRKKFIHLKVGGGSHAGQTCVNLRVDGNVVATAVGENSETLRSVTWEVGAHKGKTGVIEVVDNHTGAWGHILVDEITFGNSPQAEHITKELSKRYLKALPFTWGKTILEPTRVKLNAQSPGLAGISKVPDEVELAYTLDGVRLKRQTRVLLETDDGKPLAVAGEYGEGMLVVCLANPEKWVDGSDRKAVIGNLAAAASKLSYAPMTGISPEYPLAGGMALSVLGNADVTTKPQWDDFETLWKEFADSGKLAAGATEPSAPGLTWNGALSASVSLAPGEEKAVTFALAWHFPNRMRDDRYGWGPPAYQSDFRLGNRYSAWFKNVSEVVDYLAANFDRLAAETHLFHDTLYDSTLPRYYLDCVTANISTIRSPVYIWLEDGTFGGFEGADKCCPMNCTHVYNYAMSTAFLFPDLERNVRETDLLVQMHPTEHYIPHRTVLPLSEPRLGDSIGGPQHPALDGELGTILKLYREWQLCGDRAWLEKMWDRAKTHMLYAMEHHDPKGEGIIRGEQPNTYDTHLYGSNTFIGTLYLAALRAAEEMAKLMNDSEAAGRFRERFDKGLMAYDRTCWNGEFYYNVFDAPDADEKAYNSNNCFGPGCHADQLFGQWWAYVLGIGYVLPKERVVQALRALHTHCWKSDLSDHHHRQRVFAEGEETGLLICTWPRGGRPENPILYCDEVWTGIEYHVAASMIYEGMVTEGLQIVCGARERYTGSQRNPWGEIECGYHYARAMSAHSLLTAAAGLEYDAATGRLAMDPRINAENYRGFFSGAKAWGTVSQNRTGSTQRNTVEIKYGAVELKELALNFGKAVGHVKVTVNGKPVAVRREANGQLQLAQLLILGAGDCLEAATKLA